LTVRILEWDNEGNVAVYFTTDAKLDGNDYVVEGLVVADMDDAIIEPGVGAVRNDTGSGGNSNSDNDPFKPTYDCVKCGGDGDVQCSNCDGKGGKYKTDNSTPNYSGSTSGSKTAKTWENCYKCRGSGETTCPSCNGSGKK
jgi:hypothetical protein